LQARAKAAATGFDMGSMEKAIAVRAPTNAAIPPNVAPFKSWRRVSISIRLSMKARAMNPNFDLVVGQVALILSFEFSIIFS